MTDGDIILVDKPKGITSFDVIRHLRRESGIRKMGHAGTLDPLATGLLIIGVNEGTKKLTALVGLPKTYEAVITLGSGTDSGDADGKIVREMPVPAGLDQEKIAQTLAGMKGTLNLPVSAFSAIKRDGVPLYKYAHKGQEVELPMRDMIVRDVRLVSYDSGLSGAVSENTAVQKTAPKTRPKITAIFDVSSGTYVRSLAEELGRRLGTCAHITDLRRLSIGDYKVSEARKI